MLPPVVREKTRFASRHGPNAGLNTTELKTRAERREVGTGER